MKKKQELVDRAIRFGFVSKTLYNKPYKYSSLEPLRYSLWMEELKKHFRERNLILLVEYVENNKRPWFYNVSVPDVSTNFDSYDTYEDALETGLLYVFTKYFPE